MLLIAFLLAVVLVPALLASAARARHVSRAKTLWLIVDEAFGVVVVSAGFLFLAFNGSVQDYGEAPGNTLGVSVPLLAAGAVIALAPWFYVWRGPRR